MGKKPAKGSNTEVSQVVTYDHENYIRFGYRLPHGLVVTRVNAQIGGEDGIPLPVSFVDRAPVCMNGAINFDHLHDVIIFAVTEKVDRDLERVLAEQFKLTEEIKKRAQKEETPGGLTKKEHLINIVYEELVKFIGGEKNELKITEGKKPNKIMLVGLFGSGKTTTTGKLAKWFTKRGKHVALVGLDVHRPAAMEQIEQVAKNAKVPVFLDKKEKDPVKIYQAFEKEYPVQE